MQDAWTCRIPLLLLLSAGVHCLLVIDPPEVIYQQSSPAQLQTPILFSCFEVRPNSTSLSCPRRNVIWMKNGAILDLVPGKYRIEADKRQLQVQNLSEADTGIYQCAHHLNSTDKGSAVLWIAPSILYAPITQVLLPSGNQIVECVSGGLRSVRWTKNGQMVAVSNGTSLQQALNRRYSIFPNGSLLIAGVGAADAGMYSCLVYNKAGNDSTDIKLAHEGMEGDQEEINPMNTTTIDATTVATSGDRCVHISDYRFAQGPAVIIGSKLSSNTSSSPAAPAIQTISPSCVQAIEGYSIVLNCTVTGLPYPAVCWEKDSVAITTPTTSQMNETHFRQLRDGSLLINTLQPSDRGNYTCHAKSSLGSASRNITLVIQSVVEICGFDGNGSAGANNGFSGSRNGAGVRKKRIYSGRVVPVPNQWPWQVILEFPTLGNSVEKLCGGALIRPDWVLTAAHCVQDVKPANLVVRAGVFNRSANEETQQVLNIKAVYTHPNFVQYNEHNPMYDIALLKLGTPVQLTPSVGLVCLPKGGGSQEPADQTMCTVAGWGHEMEGSNVSPDLLHEAVVPVVSLSKCREGYSFVSNNWLCAGYTAGGPDACQNDSGGPLVCKQGTRWTEYGIAILGSGCGEPHKYGIYTRVTRFMEWINNICAAKL